VLERRHLPAGDALRVVRLEAGNFDDEGDAGPILVSLTYLIPVTAPDATLWLRFWTPHLLAADTLVADFDDVARAVELTR
jgi:hypothetical protein